LRISCFLTSWERGLSFPSTPSLLKLSALYGRQAEALFLDLYQKIKEEVLSEALNKNQDD